ncbi:unnamed protein product, partial [Prorocentrum cordatum]
MRGAKVAVNAKYDAREVSVWGLSDHAMIELAMETRAEARKHEQAIPPFIFTTDACAKQLEVSIAASELEDMATQGAVGARQAPDGAGGGDGAQPHDADRHRR